jgi:endonuclease/exonuclease/phosphatase family metal-dependent hydrolase
MDKTITLFFWNVAKRNLSTFVSSAIKEHKIDIVVLAESEIRLDELRKRHPILSEPETFSDSKIQLFTTGDPSAIVPVFDDPAHRLTIRRLIIPGHTEILLAAVHFFDRINWSEYDQLIAATHLANDIARAEEAAGHERTLLVGDLNMNPFDKAVVAAGGLHGVMTRSIANGGARTVANRKYAFFYNPMWSFLGDRQHPPPGTHFFRRAVPVVYFWNLVDQVLVRPSLMHSLRDVRILDAIDGHSLLNAVGRPVVSDHLPVLFRLYL